MSKQGEMKLSEAMARAKYNCPHCHNKLEVHAIGRNKQTMAKFKTGKDVISMACWTNNCPMKGKEVQKIWEH